jgi:hypothetical protein
VSQTFVARHSGLWSVEVTARRAQPEVALPEDSQVVCTLARTDRPEAAPVVVSVPAAAIQDGQHLRFRFSPLFDSRDAPYRMTLAVTGCPAGDCPLTLAYTAVEAYAGGALSVDGVSTAGDLRFVTRYAYSSAPCWPTPAAAVVIVAAAAGPAGGVGPARPGPGRLAAAPPPGAGLSE